MVALQPDEAAKSPSREQDEAHRADGFEFGPPGAVLLFQGIHLRRHLRLDALGDFSFNPLVRIFLDPLDPRFLGGPGGSIAILAGEEQEQCDGGYDYPMHQVTLPSIGSRPGSQAMHSVLNWHHEQWMPGCG